MPVAQSAGKGGGPHAPLLQSETLIRVRYADTDQMKRVYYGKYFEYFEQGRSDLLRAIGLPYPEIERLGYFLPVMEAHAEYLKPAGYDDEIAVRTMFLDMPGVRLRMEYEITAPLSGDLLVKGHTVHVFLSAATGKPVRAPGRFLDAVRAAAARNAVVPVV